MGVPVLDSAVGGGWLGADHVESLVDKLHGEHQDAQIAGHGDRPVLARVIGNTYGLKDRVWNKSPYYVDYCLESTIN